MASQDEIQRLWRINRTCSEMLKDRGYLVPDEKLTLTLDQFKEDYGVGDATREGMTMVVPKMSDPQDQVRPARRPLTPAPSRKHCQHLLLQVAQLPCRRAAVCTTVSKLARQAASTYVHAGGQSTQRKRCGADNRVLRGRGEAGDGKAAGAH